MRDAFDLLGRAGGNLLTLVRHFACLLGIAGGLLGVVRGVVDTVRHLGHGSGGRLRRLALALGTRGDRVGFLHQDLGALGDELGTEEHFADDLVHALHEQVESMRGQSDASGCDSCPQGQIPFYANRLDQAFEVR